MSSRISVIGAAALLKPSLPLCSECSTLINEHVAQPLFRAKGHKFDRFSRAFHDWEM